MIYLKTSIGIELRGEDMLLSSLQSTFSEGVFTHFKRVADYRLREKDDLRRDIDAFFRSNGLSRDNIVLGLPRKDIVLRHLDLPSEVADNLKQVVRYQVQTFEPTEEETLYYDYVRLDKEKQKNRITVLLATVRKALLDEHLNLLQELGIRPAMVLGSSIGLSNIFMQSRKQVQDKTFVLADLRTSAFEVLALHNGAFSYSREIAREGDQNWKDIILREVDEATSKMRLGPNDSLEKIVLAGEASVDAHEELKIDLPDCELMKTSVPFEVPAENVPHLQEAAASLGLACTGLLRKPFMRMNLLPPEHRIQQNRWNYIPAVLLGLAIIVLLLGIGFHEMFQNRILIRKLDREIEKLRAPVEEVQSLRSQADELEASIQSLDELLGRRDRNLEILQDLTTALPSDTFLTTYNYRDVTIQVAGSSGSSADLISKLEQSSFLKDVETRGPIFKDPRTGKDRFTFEAKLEQ